MQNALVRHFAVCVYGLCVALDYIATAAVAATIPVAPDKHRFGRCVVSSTIGEGVVNNGAIQAPCRRRHIDGRCLCFTIAAVPSD